MSQPQTADQADERPGHHWKDPERVHDFVVRMEARSEDRTGAFRLIARLCRVARADDPFRILDIGAGYGAGASALLTAFPNASATLLDVSDEMIKVGGEKMRPFAGRFAYVPWDFAEGTLPGEPTPAFDAAVSSLAIHHLAAGETRRLYGEVARRLTPGGAFFNFDLIEPAAGVGDIYRQLDAEDRAASEQPPGQVRPRHSHLQPLSNHLQWLTQAGLTRVDCHWKRLGLAIFGGYKASDGPALEP